MRGRGLDSGRGESMVCARWFLCFLQFGCAEMKVEPEIEIIHFPLSAFPTYEGGEGYTAGTEPGLSRGFI